MARPSTRSIVVAGGGSAGHITPGLAVMAAYRRMFPDVRLLFVGSDKGFEGRLVESRGFELATLPAYPYARQGSLGKARALATLPRGILSARALLLRREASLVLSLGGYAAAPTVLAAWRLGVPVLGFESNVRPGMVNRRSASIVRRMLVAWEDAAASFEAAKVVVTGTPVLSSEVRASDASDVCRILVVGGSEGSPFLNGAAPSLAASLVKTGLALSIVHQTGFGDPAKVGDDYRSRGVEARVESFIEDMTGAYAQADFVISSAGAVTLAELACQGLPAMITPVGTVAEDHQAANGRAYCRSTGAIEAPEGSWDERALVERLAALLSDREALSRLGQRALALARPRAAEAIVEECEAALS